MGEGLRIAFFTESYPPTHDGVASVVSGLARAHARRGHSVEVHAPRVPGAPPQASDGGIVVRRSRAVPVPLYAEYRWALFPFAGLVGDGFGHRVDVVHVHTPGMMGTTGFLAARRWTKPLVGTFHTNIYGMQESFPSRPFVRWFLRIAAHWGLGTYWRCDVTTTPTEAARAELLRRATKPFRRPVEVVPNGIEVDRFRPGVSVPDWRERCGLPSAPLVTYLGRLTADKGVLRFLEALSQVDPRTEFVGVVGGTGPEAAEVRRRLARDDHLARRVRYVGPVAEEEKAALLSQSDVFVLPSTADTSSVALLEAMASGAAVVGPDEGGPRDLVDDGVTGRRVDVRAPGALGRALSELLGSPDERRRLARAGVEFVRRSASIDAMAGRFISLYEVLLAERG